MLIIPLQTLAPVSFWEYVVVFLIGFGCFLIGWIFSKKNTKKKYERLLTTSQKKAEVPEQLIAPSGVRARKTRDRSGKAVHSDDINSLAIDTSEIDYERLGTASASEKDDLKRIKGVGPFIEKKLNAIDIYTFDQISRFTKDDMRLISDLISYFPGRMERDDWKGQAAVLKKDHEADFSDRLRSES